MSQKSCQVYLQLLSCSRQLLSLSQVQSHHLSCCEYEFQVLLYQVGYLPSCLSVSQLYESYRYVLYAHHDHHVKSLSVQRSCRLSSTFQSFLQILKLDQLYKQSLSFSLLNDLLFLYIESSFVNLNIL